MNIFTVPDEGNRFGEGKNGSAIRDRTCWVALGLSRAECNLIKSQSITGAKLAVENVDSIAEVMRGAVDFVAVLSPDLVELFEQSAPALIGAAQVNKSTVAVLLPWKQPPTQFVRSDGTVSSFLCSTPVFHDLLRTISGNNIDTLCFCLLNAILNKDIFVDRLSIKQLPVSPFTRETPGLGDKAAVIIAHRGSINYLEVALKFLEHVAASSMISVKVGLDVENADEYGSLIDRFRRFEFFKVTPAPAGPYVIRQQLIERSSEYLIVFQDSDDISCHDRFTLQYAEMRKTNTDLIGCHELCVDEINRRVEALRFPLDISAALSSKNSAALSYQAKDPILPATAMIVREGLVNAGGLSTDQKIANDTQFVLRAYFSLKMRNVDEFLYIRRKHKTALTVAGETALGTKLRQSLASSWAADFEAVKSGKARLESTSLVTRRGLKKHSLTRLSVSS